MGGGASVRTRRPWGRYLASRRVNIGLPLALAYGWLAAPTALTAAAGLGIATLGVAVRAAAAGHLRKHEALTTAGPYAFTRHPLYLGSLLIEIGLLVAARSWLAAVLGAAYFVGFYPGAMTREEEVLRRRYGSAYEQYSAHVPMFWPRPLSLKRSQWGFSWALYRRNREVQSALGLLLATVVLWLKVHFGA